MHDLSIGKSVFTYLKNGKFYNTEIDWNTEIELEEQDILDEVNHQITDTTSSIYGDTNFLKYVNDIFYSKSGIEKFLNSSSIYKTRLELILLQFGSYEFIKESSRVFQESSEDQKEKLLIELDKRINNIQSAILQNCKELKSEDFSQIINYTSKLEQVYLKYLENYAPQRMVQYTTAPINFTILENMQELKEESLNGTEMSEIADKLIDFNSMYDLENIIKIFNLYTLSQSATTEENRNDYFHQIDQITLGGVTAHGINKSLLNLANISCVMTFEKIADNIPYRINTLGEKKENLVEETIYLINILKSLKNFYLQKGIYNQETLKKLLSESLFLNKILQISYLKILPENEQKKLDYEIENFFEKEDVDYPQMDKLDKSIEHKKEMDESEVLELFESSMIFMLKDGIIPTKYCEHLVGELLNSESILNIKLNDSQKQIIMENFARIKSKQLTNSENYITYSTELYNRNNGIGITVGEHMPGFIRLIPKICDDNTMNTILNIVTIYHELRHEQQKRSISSNEYNHLTYMMVKESAIRLMDYDFYSRNYDSMYEELDAEYFAIKNTIKFLTTLELGNFRQDQKYITIMQTLEDKKTNIENRFLFAKTKNGKDGKNMQVEIFLDEKIKENPELLEKFPIFRIEYNEDGTRKSIEQIFTDFTIICREKNNRLGNYDLYKYILFSRVGKNWDECMEISDIEVPKDLSYATREALNKLKYAIVEKGVEKISGDIEDVIPGMMEQDRILHGEERLDFIQANEKITPEMRSKYKTIFGDNDER